MAGPSRPAPRVAAVPAAGRIPVSSDTAAAPATGPYPASSQEPTLIGELGLKTRSMLVNRAGRPRSWTRAAADRLIAPSALTLAARASSRWPDRWAAAASTEEAPARPPKNRYPATSGACHTGSLITGRP